MIQHLDNLFALGYKALADVMMRPVPANVPALPPAPESATPKIIGKPVYRYVIQYHNLDLDCVEATPEDAQVMLMTDYRIASMVKLSDEYEPPFCMDRDALHFELSPS